MSKDTTFPYDICYRKVDLKYFGKYQRPMDLMLDKNVSDADKILMFKQWLEDEESLSRATEEGMLGIDRCDILKEVNIALLSLDSSTRGS